MAWEAVAEHGLITLGIHAIERLRRVRFWHCSLINRKTEMRVAFSAFLKISDGQRYVLVRNLHRPETFSPFGGVLKHNSAAVQELDECQFKPDAVGNASDAKNDLRGFLPRARLRRIVRWYDGVRDRESAGECLMRELREELNEIGLRK